MTRQLRNDFNIKSEEKWIKREDRKSDFTGFFALLAS
jgi:hypothetical protein